MATANLDSGHFEPLNLDAVAPPVVEEAEPDLEIVASEAEDTLDVEVVDDTPDADKGKPRRAEGSEPNIPTDEDLANHSEGVQKRIKKLRYEYHEERRSKEASERLRDEAVTYAQTVNAENQRLRQGLESGQDAVVAQAKARVVAELATAKRGYKEAYDAGDSDALVEAQQALNKSQNDMFRLNSHVSRVTPPAAQPQAPQAPQAPKKPELDEMQKQWVSENDWFGPDLGMTGFAFGIHEELVKSGVDPHTKAYYDKIDSEMRRVFADKFDEPAEAENAQVRKPATVVAPASRNAKKSRKVTITASQARLARQLGVTPEEYAVQLMLLAKEAKDD